MLITTKPHVRLDAFRFLVCGHRLSLSLTFIIAGGGIHVGPSTTAEKLHLLTGRNDLAQEIVRSK